MYGEGYTQEEERGHGGRDSVKGRLGDGALIGTGQNKTKKQKRRSTGNLVVVAHAFNPSIWEAEAGRFLSSKPTWSTE